MDMKPRIEINLMITPCPSQGVRLMATLFRTGRHRRGYEYLLTPSFPEFSHGPNAFDEDPVKFLAHYKRLAAQLGVEFRPCPLAVAATKDFKAGDKKYRSYFRLRVQKGI